VIFEVFRHGVSIINGIDFMNSPKRTLKDRLKDLAVRIKKLQGDPRYVATGMAIGVFVGVTPTIPFHTLIAIAMAFIFKGSKPAAAIGVWFANPITIPIFYIGSFKVGTLILNRPIPFDVKFESISALMTLGLDATIAMIVGGAVLGILPAIVAYILTYRIVAVVREKARKKKDSRDPGVEGSGSQPTEEPEVPRDQ
jgi:uncharacterized protein